MINEIFDIKTLQDSDQAPDEPFALFDDWFNTAKQSEPVDPNAMTLATCTKEALPSARIVLLKEHDERGFVFYTNTQSRKASELDQNTNAALIFYWKSLNRQIRIEGRIEKVSDEQADNYYNSRHKGSRIGAWASKQSQILASRAELKDQVEEFEKKYKDEEQIPRPPHWGGFRVVPNYIEFWHDGEFRLHTRLIYERAKEAANLNAVWTKRMLYP